MTIEEKDTEKVTGGNSNRASFVTEMRCSNCGHFSVWDGDFEGKVVDCPRCNKHTFRAERVIEA